MPATSALSPMLSEASGAEREEGAPFTLAMLERALLDQQDLSAVERFSQLHDAGIEHARAERFSTLMPASPPGPCQQYAFEVDLDLCTGCKACVAACHSQNGLDEGESFRSVGLLHGGADVAPWQQTVTAACHHCLDPACLNGCPVLAYEKDPVTGIVHHLDDQCIGCQYCVLTCPYEVPRFHADKGIVRKCDMCRGRLEVGEPPACVQACPNEAIGIRIVEVAQVGERAEVGSLVPGAPASSMTRPSTTYRSKKPLPENALPADYHAVRPAKDHIPLVVMLVLTQLSVGAFAVEQFVRMRLGGAAREAFAAGHAPFALFIGLFSLAASVGHLGRPLGAFRAVLGIRRSWLSREILAFGGFATAALAHAALSSPLVLPMLPPSIAAMRDQFGPVVVALGVAGICTSVMVYHVTHRELWRLSLSGPRFFGTAAVLGIASTIATATAVAYATDTNSLGSVTRTMMPWLIASTLAKLGLDLSIFVHLHDRTRTELRRTAEVLAGPLSFVMIGRVSLALLGALLIPALFVQDGVRTSAAVVGSVASLVALVAGEMLERSLFFRAQRSARMPGGLW